MQLTKIAESNGIELTEEGVDFLEETQDLCSSMEIEVKEDMASALAIAIAVKLFPPKETPVDPGVVEPDNATPKQSGDAGKTGIQSPTAKDSKATPEKAK